MQLLEEYPDKTSKGIKGFLVTSQHMNGIGNSYAQDILFRARLSPRRKIPDITPAEREQLYHAIQETVRQAIQAGGREDERDLFDHPGGYRRLMSSQTAGTPLPGLRHDRSRRSPTWAGPATSARSASTV